MQLFAALLRRAWRRHPPSLAVVVAALVLAGCASAPRPGRDGGPATPPPGVANTPDAVPRVEPIRSGGPNKPYVINGRRYVPVARDTPIVERGLASWYGRKFDGRPTANGETYDMYAMTAAHPTMPLPSYARVTNPANGREIIVRVNDRGPFHPGRIIDLSYAAALRLDLLRGVAPVQVERLTNEAIRTGAWRRPPGDASPPDDTRLARSEPAPRADGAPPAPPPADPVPAGAVPLPQPVLPVATAAPSPPAAGFWVQLGAFRDRDGAQAFAQRVSDELDWLAARLGVQGDAPLYRLQAGPYASRDEAQAVAERVREALQLVPLLVERR